MKEFIYSRNAVYEALRARRRQFFRLQLADGLQEKGRILAILQMAEECKVPILRAPRAALERIHPAHQGVVIEASGYPYSDLEGMLALADRQGVPPFLLLLDSLNDPQNFGALLRTAEAVGCHGVILPLAHSVEVTPTVVNASSGASEHLLVTRMNLSQAIDALRENDIWVVGLDESPEAQLPDAVRLDGGLAVVVGSEGQGIRSLIHSKCDFLMRLPMQGRIESLNAAVAGSVALYLAYLARMRSSSTKGGS